MKITIPLLFVLSICLIFSPDTIAQSTKASNKVVKTFSEDGAWCWFSDPRAVYYEGEHQRTYAGWVDSTGNIMIGYFDHANGEIKTHILHENLEVDDHDNPALHFTEEGKLMIFYAKHSTESPIYQMVSREPENISEWEERRSLYLNDTVTYEGYSKTYTYANVWKVQDELFLLWRGMDFKPNYSISKDDGQTWSQGKILILPERIYSNRRPYVKVYSDGGEKLHIAFTDGHPRNETENSIYYAYYQQGDFYKANGDKITSLADVPFTPEQAELVHNGNTDNKTWIWDIAADDEGNPVLTYASFPTDTAHYYHYARWNGKQWEKEKLIHAGKWFPQTQPNISEREMNYSGGVVLDHENPSTVYLSREHEGVFEIEQWQRKGKGRWDKFQLTTSSSLDNVRPYAVYNAKEGNPMQMFFMTNERYVHYTDYRSAIKMWVNPTE
ncbi:BNR-4 repeat-containing protein [Catalinimonas niigatensis]|uniref:BNR-4 repeat-containing protein n=1 Tax=Catalinimonas niigatensis TaxID=1397264 RepID=UPI002666F003|nr:BNR-4 repeat-containing protein [Catalinimonas niigatensis]WPP51569.1 BNR-4 repeat-containing protein [Catalinimonas niigatensis]